MSLDLDPTADWATIAAAAAGASGGWFGAMIRSRRSVYSFALELIQSTREEIARLETKLERLETENAELRAELELLKERTKTR